MKRSLRVLWSLSYQNADRHTPYQDTCLEDPSTGQQSMTTTHRRKGPEHEKATVNERVDRNIFSMKGLNIFNTFAFFNRTLQESLLLQNKRVNQDKGKHDI